MKKNEIFKITFSALMIALGIILPFVTGMQLGNVICPMHIPVLLCGFILGWKYGLIVGLICPLLRSLLFGLPPIYPTAISMSVELAVYGLCSGLLFNILRKTNIKLIFVVLISLVISQLAGRLAWGLVRFLMGLIDKTNVFTFALFIQGAFVIAWPGILLQLILIPVLILSLNKLGYIK